MREISFKAKRLDNGEWVEGYYVRYGFTGKEKHYIVPFYASDLYAFEIDPTTICQYTGLTDKNGKKIFEGDIIKSDLNKIGKIAFNEDYLAYTILESKENRYYYLCDCDSENVEVIGNIFDNPELLEED